MPIQSLAIVQVLKAFMACINNNNNDDFVVVFCETLQSCSTVCEWFILTSNVFQALQSLQIPPVLKASSSD